MSANPQYSNKEVCNLIFADAIDRARQKVWEQVQAGILDKKKAENILVNMDKALAYSKMYLHDQISGKDAQFIVKIRKDRTVLMGHQAQAVYFSVGWDTIHKINADILEFEKLDPIDTNGNRVINTTDAEHKDVAVKEVRRLQLESLRNKGIITYDDYLRYRKEMGLDEDGLIGDPNDDEGSEKIGGGKK